MRGGGQLRVPTFDLPLSQIMSLSFLLCMLDLCFGKFILKLRPPFQVSPGLRAAHTLFMILPTLGMGEEIPWEMHCMEILDGAR